MEALGEKGQGGVEAAGYSAGGLLSTTAFILSHDGSGLQVV